MPEEVYEKKPVEEEKFRMYDLWVESTIRYT